MHLCKKRWCIFSLLRLQHFRKLFNHIVYNDIKTRYNVFRKYANDVLMLLTRNASALCLMLGATHLVALRPTLEEQSSLARLQASLQTRSASIIGAGNNSQAKYDCCCSGCYRRGKQVINIIKAFRQILRTPELRFGSLFILSDMLTFAV